MKGRIRALALWPVVATEINAALIGLDLRNGYGDLGPRPGHGDREIYGPWMGRLNIGSPVVRIKAL